MKKIVSLLSVTLLLFAMIGCGDDSKAVLAEYTYVVLDEFELFDGGVYADVLVSDMATSISEEEVLAYAKALCKIEGFDDLAIYCTEDAYEANYSSSFSEANPNALEEGFICSYTDGKITFPVK